MSLTASKTCAFSQGFVSNYGSSVYMSFLEVFAVPLIKIYGDSSLRPGVLSESVWIFNEVI